MQSLKITKPIGMSVSHLFITLGARITEVKSLKPILGVFDTHASQPVEQRMFLYALLKRSIECIFW